MQPPQFLAAPTVVGSFPHVDAQPLVSRLLERLPRMPAWPQLPARDWLESMYVQYAEGLPGAVVDRARQTLHFRSDNGLHEALEGFYEAVIAENLEPFAIGRDRALGLHVFLDALRARAADRPLWVKGQLTGPFSFAMTVTDEAKRSIAYDAELFEVVCQGVAMKARWLARELGSVGGGVLVVLDEPYLCSFGSAFVNVAREQVVGAIAGAVEAIHMQGALAGVHCCGNTDWSLVLETGLDVVSFDAVEFFQGMPLYPRELGAFLERGGTLAWGIVPTSAVVIDTSAGQLLAKLDDRIGQLAAKGIARDRLIRQALLTPACGLGAQSVAVADRALDLLVQLADLVRVREGF
jgi:hypothetical protein